MTRISLVLAVIFSWAGASLLLAQSPIEQDRTILIVEVQTASLASSTEEFVELFNNTDTEIDTKSHKLKLQYKSTTGTSWNTKASLGGSLQPRGRYLIATTGYLDDTSHESGLGLAGNGGHLRIISDLETGEVYDEVAWGEATSAQVNPALAPNAGESLKRLVDEDGHFIDTDDDSVDFFISSTPSPESAKKLLASQQEFQPSTGNLSDGDTTSIASQNSNRQSASLTISELFIDPEKPLTDADDEFVEIYNPTKGSVNLEDYVVKTGASFNYSFTIPKLKINSGQYLALFSIDTGLVLSNSGGAAQLIGPDGKIIYEVPSYTKAKTNSSWADVDGQWQWTDTPSPNAANLSGGADTTDLSSGLNPVLAATSNQQDRTIYEEPPQANDQVNTTVVAGVGAMALLYAGYEYRYDVGNAIHKLRRYFESRKGNRSKT